MDLLLHVVIPASHVSVLRTPLNLFCGALDDRPVRPRDLVAARGELSDISVLKKDDLSAVREEREDIRGQPRPALTHAQTEGRPLTSSH